MKQHPTLQEWTTFHKKHKDAYTRLVAWIAEQRKQQIAERGLGCSLTMEQNYWEWFTIGRMIQFLDEHTNNAETALAIDKGSMEWHVYGVSLAPANFKKSHTSVNLFDALWAMCKVVLENGGGA